MQTPRETTSYSNRLIAEDKTCRSWSIVVDDIGSVGIVLISALNKALKLDQKEIARRILHAPSILTDKLNSNTAKQISSYLKEIGLNTRAITEDETIEQGFGEYELAIVEMDYNRAAEIIKIIVELTGISSEDAITLLTKSPCVVLGNVSLANVKVLKKRFSDAGARLAVSNSKEALFDVLLAPENFAAHRELLQLFKRLGLSQQSFEQKRDTAIALQGLNSAQANQLWALAQERKINCRLLDRAYQQYNVRLETIEVEQRNALEQILQKSCKIPSNIIAPLLQRLPINIANNKTIDQACEIVAELANIKATAVAELTATLSFDLCINNVNQPDKVKELLVLIGRVTQARMDAFFKGKSDKIKGPLNYSQAKWLQVELSKLGCKVTMLKRS